ncbi:WXG100 family type VII secretion target [Kitasatospora sp. CM 4170]|uniref:WXG100 family type VII secretion target n=1 Tax=Kitasatospora aburaviensis TaxID=67265 RepID=A0ABW1F038_9ACTN|nr:WXG100 family type VII secretion target [Kitasatospora sp. CM 4170]WNM47250.1 WXG100 family type VII secretion target [Kitasatospora sp. CM 4170]
MAIELPGEVVTLLEFLGIRWPAINEDKVREFGEHVKEFAKGLEDLHTDSTATIHQLGGAYEGASYEALVAKWALMSDKHFNEVVQAAHVVSKALDTAADVIVGMKLEALGELVVLAATFVAAQAAAVATAGISEVGAVAAQQAARKLMSYLAHQLEDYVVGQVVEAAITPLVEVVSEAVSGLVFEAAEAALNGGGGSAGSGFKINPAAVESHARALHEQAEKVAQHAQVFRGRVAAMSFE